MYDIVLLTESRYENPTETDWYIDNILTEDGLVQKALEKRGLKVTRKDWAGDFDWSQTKNVLFRTTWDYFERFEEFTKWLDEVSRVTNIINPKSIIEWDMDKHYLQDLANKGINIPKTKFIKKGETKPLIELQNEAEFSKSVLKPTFSGAARHTYLLDETNIADHEKIFSELIAVEDMMLQEFQENIVSKGEISMMVMGGKFTHAILKKAKAGDFRVQDDFGGSVHQYTPTKEEIQFAEKAFAACPEAPLYGRADIFYDNNNQLAIGELELIEPELWFRFNPQAADDLAEAILTHLN